jgi:general secretion pathway protein L
MWLAMTWGLEPDQLATDDEFEDGAWSFNLLPPGANRAQAAFRRRSMAALAVSACAVLAVALYMPLKQNQEILAATKAQLAQAQTQAVQADALKKQVEEWLERSRFVVERKHHERTVTALLDELSRLLPNHTWVFEFQVRAGRLSLSGYSAKPSSLIGLLEQSEMLTEVRFSAPVKMNRKIGLESFKLTAKLTKRGKT